MPAERLTMVRLNPSTRIAGILTLVMAASLAGPGCTPADVRFNEDGLTAFRGQEYSQARAAFDEAIHENPDVGAYYYNRGMCEQALGQLGPATFSYSMAVKINPKIIQAYNNSAACYQQLGQPERALDLLDECTRSNPYTGEAFMCLSRFLPGPARPR